MWLHSDKGARQELLFYTATVSTPPPPQLGPLPEERSRRFDRNCQRVRSIKWNQLILRVLTYETGGEPFSRTRFTVRAVSRRFRV